jgi:tetratricopeptide (TPR) repeat protein
VKDSTIFKLAAGAGLLAFVGRLIFVQPDDLGVRPGLRSPGGGDEISRLIVAGDYRGAIRIAAIRQQEDYLDQRGWNRIAGILEDYQTRDARPMDSAAALETFAELAPDGWTNESGAIGYAAYFLGFQAGDNDSAQAEVAWRLGAEAFERLIRENPSGATAWDWLYRARTYMRLGDDAAARQALRDASNWVEAAIRDLDSDETVVNPPDYLRTFGRTWASVGGVQEAEAVWTSATHAMVKEWPAVDVADNWRRYASNMFRSDEDAAGEIALEMCILALAEIDETHLNTAIRAAPLWRDAARRFERRQQHSRAEEAWAKALELQAFAAEGTNDATEWVDYAELLAERVGIDPAFEALHRAVDAGYVNPDRLWAEDAFIPLHEDGRFQTLMDRINESLETLYAPQREALEESRRMRDLRRQGQRGN